MTMRPCRFYVSFESESASSILADADLLDTLGRFVRYRVFALQRGTCHAVPRIHVPVASLHWPCCWSVRHE